VSSVKRRHVCQNKKTSPQCLAVVMLVFVVAGAATLLDVVTIRNCRPKAARHHPLYA
jgi:hypothetical protein